MRVDIKSLGHQDCHSCLEDAIVSFVSWLGCDYEMIFCEAWGFVYYPTVYKQPVKLGNRIDTGDFTTWDNLEKYHGISTCWKFKESVPEQLKIITDELAEGRPVFLLADQYWLPWIKMSYQKYHLGHICLVIDYDEVNGNILCLDPFWNKDINLIPIDHFEKLGPRCTTVSIEKKKVPDFDWREVIDGVIRRMDGKAGTPNAFDAMRAFSRDMNEYMDINIELKGKEEIYYLAPLFEQLNKFEKGRGTFGIMLKYLGERFSVKSLIELSAEISEMKDKWSEIGLILKPSEEMVNPKDQIRAAACKINQVADIEEKFLLKLSKCI